MNINEIIELLDNKEIPEEWSEHIINNPFGYDSQKGASFEYRNQVTNKLGFSLISKDWIRKLAEYIGNSKCLEIMSGYGSLSYALQNEGVDIKATDDFSWKWHWSGEKSWTDIKNIDAVDVIRKYGKDIDYIIMSWAYIDDTAYRCLRTMREVNPQCKMIVIGEGSGGCTADDNFFDELEEVDSLEHINNIYPQWKYT